MKLLRSILGALGSAGGIAWSSFGILSAAFSIAVASTSAIMLAATSGGLFLMFSLPVLYVLYDHYTEEEEKLNTRLHLHEETLRAELTHFLKLMNNRSCRQFGSSKNVSIYFKAMLASSPFSQTSPELKQLLHALLNDKEFNLRLFLDANITAELQQRLLSSALIRITQTVIKNSQPPLTRYERFKACLLGFVGSFGAVAGCTSGFLGLLLGVGVLASFSTVPFLGVAIVAAAAIVSTYSAIRSVQLLEKETRKKHTYKAYRSLGAALHELNSKIDNPLVEVSHPASHWPKPAPRRSRSLGAFEWSNRFFKEPVVTDKKADFASDYEEHRENQRLLSPPAAF